MINLKNINNKKKIHTINHNIKILPELRYSKILAVKNMANVVFNKTNNLIQNIQLDLSKNPLVSSIDNDAFQHFISYNNEKIQFKNDKRYRLAKMIIILIIIVILFKNQYLNSMIVYVLVIEFYLFEFP